MRPGSVGPRLRPRPHLRQLTDTRRQLDNQTHDDLRCALVRMSAHTNDKSTEAQVRRFPDAESFVVAAAYHGGAVERRGHRVDTSGVS
jgi:hypothetical protein